MKLRHLRAALIAAAVMPVVSQSVRAATIVDYIWNPPGGGSGAWTNGASNWSTSNTGTPTHAWASDGTTERANFNNTAGIVTIGGASVTSVGIIFGTAGYTITGATLKLAAAPVTLSGGTETITAPIAGTSGLTETGGGTLILNAANSYTGTTTVSASTLNGVAQSAGSPFSTGAMTLSGAGLKLTGIGSSTSTSVGTFTVAAPSGVNNAVALGASNLIIDNTAGGTGVTTTLAAGALTRGGVGSVLLITPQTGNLGTGTGTGEVVTFTNGASLVSNTILPAWVITQAPSTGVGDFTTYGANGVTIATYSPSDLTTSTNASVVNQTTVPTITADVSAYALRTNQAIDLNTHTLNLGNGSGQTGLILNGGSIADGNINFGSTEAMIYSQGSSSLGMSGDTFTSNDLTIGTSGSIGLAVNNTMTVNGGINFIGSTNVYLNGPVAITGGNRSFINTIPNTGGVAVTFGAGAGSSTITLGGSDGTGRTLTIGSISPSTANTTTVINDVIQDPALGGGTHSGSVIYLGGNPSLTQINALNTYTGPTTLNGTTNAAIQFSTDSQSDGLSGPFGATASTLIFNNTSNNQLQPIGGNRTVANPISLVFGWTISNAAGDTTSGVTFTGALAETTSGRTLTNNLSTAGSPVAQVVVGSATNPTTLTLSNTSGSGTTIAGTGNTIFNDSINDFSGIANNLTVSSTGTTTFNGNISSNGNLSITGGGTEVFNGVRSGPGSTTSTGTFTFSSATGGIVYLNTQNSYSGANSVTTSAGLLRIGASSDSVTSPTKGPLGTGTITINQGNAPPQFQAVNGDQMISNPMTLTSGFFVSTGVPNFSLTFAGAISPAAGKTITNNTVLAKPFVLGDPTSPSTITLAGGLAFQTNVGTTSNTVINDTISGASGALTAQNNAIVLVKGQASYGGTTTVQSTTNNTSGQSLTFAKSLTSSPTVNITSGKLTMASDGSHNVVLKTNTLTISTTGVGTAPPGKLDLTDNKLVVHGGSPGTPTSGTYNGIQGLVQSGRNGGGWNGTAGIITSASTTSSGRELTTLGVALNSDLGTRATFGGVPGVPVASNDVLVMYTYAGDADLNGVINGDDYARIDAAFGGSPLSGGVGYENGDFNYDGKIDADDYFLIDSNYAAQGNPISAGPGIGGAAPLGLSGVSAVPEPGSLGVGLVSLGFYFGTRRRKQR